MMVNKDVPPTGSGCSAEPEPLRVSADTASIPNALELIVARALFDVEWQWCGSTAEFEGAIDYWVLSAREAISTVREYYRKRAAQRGKDALSSGDQIEITVETTFRGRLAKTLLAEAAARDQAPAALLSDVVETVLSENLITAVMDDAQEKAR